MEQSVCADFILQQSYSEGLQELRFRNIKARGQMRTLLHGRFYALGCYRPHPRVAFPNASPKGSPRLPPRTLFREQNLVQSLRRDRTGRQPQLEIIIWEPAELTPV